MRLVSHPELSSFVVVDHLSADTLHKCELLFSGTIADARAMRKALNTYIDAQPAPIEPEVNYKELRDDDIVGAYIKLRDMRSATKDKFEAKDNKYAEKIDALQIELLRRYTERGIDQIKVAGVGTSFRSTKVVASCGDWDVFFTWCIEQIDKSRTEGRDPRDVFAFFQKRLTIDTVKQHMETHEGGVPPAVNVMQQYAVSVRRSTT
jgi:hypothetical protein